MDKPLKDKEGSLPQIMTEAVLQQALEHLSTNDARLAELLKVHGMPALRHREAGFPGLLRIILAQQVSVAAADALELKLRVCYPTLDPHDFIEASPEDLRACGMSRQKSGYMKGLAEAIVSGSFKVNELPELSDEDVVKRITALKGFGPWSAEIYCMFCLKRVDIFPASDLAIQTALQRFYEKRQRPDAEQTRILAEKWRPYRSAVATFLWHYYRGNPG